MDVQSEKLSARVGEPITIRLRSNPTTGIGWQAIYDAQAVELVDKNGRTRRSKLRRRGRSADFQTLAPGAVSITLELRRPREKGAREMRAVPIQLVFSVI